jgi:hypothetical protein
MSKRTRNRSGCLSCRARKKKCDGARPRCSNCQSRGEACCFGLKASFHPSRELQLSSEDGAALLASEARRGDTHIFPTSFVDDTAQIVRGYETESVTAVATPPAGESVEQRFHATTEALTTFESGVTYNDVSEPTPPRDCTSANPMPVAAEPGSGISSQECPDHSGECDDLVCLGIELPVTKNEQIKLIRAFLQETGSWCEVTDSTKHFTVKYIHSLMENKPFAAAAMAVASLQQDAVCRKSREVTLSLYQHAVHSLLHYEPSQCGEATLVCCVLLSMYEMMTRETAPTEWRRHLKVSLRP